MRWRRRGPWRRTRRCRRRKSFGLRSTLPRTSASIRIATLKWKRSSSRLRLRAHAAPGEREAASGGRDLMTPREIVAELNKYIVGQDAAKKAVAIAIRNRW